MGGLQLFTMRVSFLMVGLLLDLKFSVVIGSAAVPVLINIIGGRLSALVYLSPSYR